MSGVPIIAGASRGIGAEAGVFLVSSRASYIHGTTIDVTGGV